MKVYLLVLLLLVPLCSGANTNAAGEHSIRCYAYDGVYLFNDLLECNSKTQQACFHKANGEKGCVDVSYCSNSNWNCCHTDSCNQ